MQGMTEVARANCVPFSISVASSAVHILRHPLVRVIHLLSQVRNVIDSYHYVTCKLTVIVIHETIASLVMMYE